MAVMYQAMLNAYGRNPLALYAETVGALDIATQRANDERQRVELAEAQREAYDHLAPFTAYRILPVSVLQFSHVLCTAYRCLWSLVSSLN